MPPAIPRTPVAAGMLVYRLWRKLPAEQKKVVLLAARRHGPRLATAAFAAAKARKLR